MAWACFRKWLLAVQARRLPVLAFAAGHFCDGVRVHWRGFTTLLSDAPDGPQPLYRRPVDVWRGFPVSGVNHADWPRFVAVPIAPCRV